MTKTHRAALVAGILSRSAHTDIARRALHLIDPERVSSVPSLVSDFTAKVAAVGDDKNLSAHGKREATRAAASSRLGNVATAARELVSLERQHATRRNAILAHAAPPSADAAQTLVDMELARLVKAEAPTPTALTFASERVRQALARLPVELTGIDEATHARIVGTFVSPLEAMELEEESAVLADARRVVQAGIDDLAPAADWSAREVLEAFGADGGWNLPGLVQTLERVKAAASEAAATE